MAMRLRYILATANTGEVECIAVLAKKTCIDILTLIAQRNTIEHNNYAGAERLYMTMLQLFLEPADTKGQ